MDGLILFVISCFIASIIFVFFYIRQTHLKDAPPCYGGRWKIPWLGCAVEFGKAPLYFIEQARKKLGSVFTLQVAGERLTFLTCSDDFHLFFQSKYVDFQQAVQNPVCMVASVSKDSFLKYHTKIHDTVKARLAPANLDRFCENVTSEFKRQIDCCWGEEGTGDLNTLIRTTMYITILENIMGPGVLPTRDQRAFKILEEHFVVYDDQFEYGSQLPEFFLKDWSKSKSWLLEFYSAIVDKVSSPPSSHKKVFNLSEAFDTSVLQSLIDEVDERHAPNYSLLLMWASLANAVPITFWTLAFILSSENLLPELRAEVDEVLKNKDEKNFSLTQVDLQNIPSVKRCVLEAIRLRSPGAVPRRVIAPFSVNGYTIPEGDMLMISPYWAHRNPRFFPNPDEFSPDRWKSVDVAKNVFLEGFVAFGGGRYQCPGRWFGLMEIHGIVAMLIHFYDIKLLRPVPDLSPLHLVGTQQPARSLPIQFVKRL